MGPGFVSTDLYEVGLPPEAFHQVLDIWYMLKLAELEGLEVTFVVLIH